MLRNKNRLDAAVQVARPTEHDVAREGEQPRDEHGERGRRQKENPGGAFLE